MCLGYVIRVWEPWSAKSADPEKVLADDKLWIDSKGREGTQADLRWAWLDGADLSLANLSDVAVTRFSPPAVPSRLNAGQLISGA
jgi:hypothetical protein